MLYPPGPLHLEGDALLRDLPGYTTVKKAEESARLWAFKETTMIKHRLRRIESLLNHGDGQARAQRPPRQLQTVQDGLDLLQEQVETIRAEP